MTLKGRIEKLEGMRNDVEYKLVIRQDYQRDEEAISQYCSVHDLQRSEHRFLVLTETDSAIF